MKSYAKEDYPRCVHKVWHGWAYHQCQRKNGHGPDKLLCWQHAKKGEK